MDLSAVCRTCLSSDSLTPIFMEDDDKDTYSSAIYVAIGVKIQFNDMLPQKMCTDCNKKLNDILKFRKQCKYTERKLLRALAEDKPSIIDKEYNETNVENTSKRERLKNYINNDYVSDETIKSEICNDEIKSETDLDDDRPLQELINNNINLIKFEKNKAFDRNIPYHESESDTEIFNEDKSTRNSKLQTHKIKRSKSIYNNDSEDSTFNDSKSLQNTTELPYELILDPVTEKVTRVKCKLCYKELSIRSIDSHMTRRHPGADGRKVKCDLCDSYVMKEKLNRHNIMMHGNGCFKCGYCKSEFDVKEALVNHVSTCTAKKRKRKVNESGRELRECDVCNKVMQKASLRMHKAVKHAGLKPVCEHCGKSFGNKFRLKEHYRAKHGYEKFKCSYCDFRSASAMALRNHERRHRGEKPFVCEACGAKFHAAYLLTQHKHSHRTEKLVKCDQCPATFKANNSLHMHKLTCHSNYMYRCKVCCRSYKCRHYAVKHVRHVHRYSGPTPPLAVVGSDELDKTTT